MTTYMEAADEGRNPGTLVGAGGHDHVRGRQHLFPQPRYIAAPEAAKPAVLALGAFLSRLFLTIFPISLLLGSAVGMPLVAVAILRGGSLPRWLGWLLLIPSVLIGYVGIPLMMLVSPSVGGPVVGLWG